MCHECRAPPTAPRRRHRRGDEQANRGPTAPAEPTETSIARRRGRHAPPNPHRGPEGSICAIRRRVPTHAGRTRRRLTARAPSVHLRRIDDECPATGRAQLARPISALHLGEPPVLQTFILPDIRAPLAAVKPPLRRHVAGAGAPAGRRAGRPATSPARAASAPPTRRSSPSPPCRGASSPAGTGSRGARSSRHRATRRR
jgi:hypothetical protein